MTFAVRIHGRGGQGVVTAAEMLAVAAFLEGRHAQAFPSFGSERTGAPVVSFCRISDAPIRTHEPVDRPDLVVIQDVTLLHSEDLFSGLPDDGYVLLNSSRSFAELGLGELLVRLRADRLLAVPATQLALEHVGRPLPNAALLGGLAALPHIVGLDAVDRAIRMRFSGTVADANVAAASAAHDMVAADIAELRHAATA